MVRHPNQTAQETLRSPFGDMSNRQWHVAENQSGSDEFIFAEINSGWLIASPTVVYACSGI